MRLFQGRAGPDWMGRPELVNRTGKLLFGDKWPGAMRTTLEILQDHPELRAEPDPRSQIRRRMAGYRVRTENALAQRLPELREARELLEDQRAEQPDKAEMHDGAVHEIREALCNAKFRSGLKARSGRIYDLPAYAWRGDLAIEAFDDEWTFYGREVRAPDGRRLIAPDAIEGLVLFERAGAEAWLTTLEARLSEGEALAAVAEAPAAVQDSPNGLEAGIAGAVPKLAKGETALPPRGYKAADERLMPEMARLVAAGLRPYAAGMRLANKAEGGGNNESKAKRLCRCFANFRTDKTEKV